MYRPAFNRTDRPVLIDAAGRQLGGREFGAVDTTSDEVKRAVANDELRVYTADFGDDAHPDAVEAAGRATLLEARRSELAGADVDRLRAGAVKAEVAPDEAAAGEMSKAELVLALTHVDAEPADLLSKPKRSAAGAGATPTIPEATS